MTTLCCSATISIEDKKLNTKKENKAKKGKKTEKKPRCRCYINASYGKAFRNGTRAAGTYKPCPVHGF